MIRATVDTSILAPSIRRAGAPRSTLAPILSRWGEGRYEMVISEHILVEVERTLTKPYFSRYLTPADQIHAIESLRIDATVVEITVVVQGVATHPEDDLILATAMSGQVDYLVTNDRQLLRLGEYQGVRIVNAGEFLSILDAETSN